MKKKYNVLIILMLAVIYIGQSHAANINVELAGSISVVQTIDLNKKIIYMNGSSISYDRTTVIYDKSGKLSDISALKQGLAISFDYDKSKRYISRPVATKIWIKSSHPLK